MREATVDSANDNMEIAAFTGVMVVMLCPFSRVTSQSAGCNPGWFGPNCRYKCRCASNDCDQVSGQCSGTCQGGWFGPACQYVDLAYRRSETIQLSDGLDDTCNTNKTTETVTFDKAYFFTWLRIHVAFPDALKQKLTVTFNPSNTNCVNQRTATVDEKTLDISCNLDIPVTSVTLTGDGVLSLCSIYVSGGRNVALNETATQSSTLFEMSINYTADKAVNGDTNPNFYAGQSCAHTRTGQSSPGSWRLNFSQTRDVNRYLIYNRQGDFAYRMVGFKIYSFDADKNLVFNYTDGQGNIPVYTVTHESQRLELVQITTASSENILTMCEVEIYGDSACEPGRYGRECEHTCNCAGGEPCFVSTGICPSGCAAGFQGDSCAIPCAFGTFGPGCLAECSDLCVTVTQYMISCDRFNGTCLLGCKLGYQGDLCTEQSLFAEPSDNGQRTAIIVGCVLGAIILILIVALVISVFRPRKICSSQKNRNPPTVTFRSGIPIPGTSVNNGNQSAAGVACRIPEIPGTSTETTQMNSDGACACYEVCEDPVADDHLYEDMKEDTTNSPISRNDSEYVNASL